MPDLPAPAAQPSPIVERLQQASSAAIINLGRVLDCDAGRLRRLTVELELSNSGAVLGSRAFVERGGVHRAPRAG